jgi:hypothetical protein
MNQLIFFCCHDKENARGQVLPDGICIFIPKMPFWVNFGVSCNERCWYFFGHFVHFIAIWYILWPFGGHFGMFLPVLVYCTNKSLATLIEACAHGPALFLRGKQMKRVGTPEVSL